MKTQTKKTIEKNNQKTNICYKRQKQRFIIAFCIDKALFFWFFRLSLREATNVATWQSRRSRISLRWILHCVQNDNMGGAPTPDGIAFFLLSFRATPRNLGVSRISLRGFPCLRYSQQLCRRIETCGFRLLQRQLLH